MVFNRSALRVFFCLLLVLPFSLATVTLVSPVSKQLEDYSSFRVGSLAPGESLELIVAKKTGSGTLFDSVSLDPASVPAGWTVSSSESFAESLGLKIVVSPSETERIVSLKLVLSQNGSAAQSVNLLFVIRNNLSRFEIVSDQSEILVGETASYQVRGVNESLAGHSFELRSSLSSSEFAPIPVSLGPANSDGSIVSIPVLVHPKSYGVRDFSFEFVSNLNQKTVSVSNESLLVKPTLAGKFESGLFGLPVLLPTLNAFYFFNALVGWVV